MTQKSRLKPLTIAAGAAFVTTLASTTVVNAAANPFAMSELSSGYMVAEMAEGKCGGAKAVDADKSMKEGKCGEGKCGGAKAADADKSMKEGKCGEGKCGGAKAVDEAVDEAKSMKEGKCGEGKCGASK